MLTNVAHSKCIGLRDVSRFSWPLTLAFLARSDEADGVASRPRPAPPVRHARLSDRLHKQKRLTLVTLTGDAACVTGKLCHRDSRTRQAHLAPSSPSYSGGRWN